MPGLRVLLVSCGAEETLQDGVRAFLARHRDELAPGRTWFVNLDTVGSPHLVMLEAEGPVWMGALRRARGCATCSPRAPSGSASRCSAASVRAPRPTA